VHKAFERQALEIAPLAFMRGRTLNNAFVILDEAQNTTPEQMKMFLTRVGFGTKTVITGDVSQIDLPKTQMSGLVEAERILRRVPGIAITRLTSADIVRHPLVARIVDAYEAARLSDLPPIAAPDPEPELPRDGLPKRRAARATAAELKATKVT
jgi:phosphate starvation-inducible PhoH-like protein